MEQIRFAPSLMCMDIINARSELEVLNENCSRFHVDIMDGHFCKNMALTPGPLKNFR